MLFSCLSRKLIYFNFMALRAAPGSVSPASPSSGPKRRRGEAAPAAPAPRVKRGSTARRLDGSTKENPTHTHTERERERERDTDRQTHTRTDRDREVAGGF